MGLLSACQLSSSFESALSLSTKQWSLHLPSGIWKPKMSHWTTAEQSKAEQSCLTERALAWGPPCPQGHLTAMLFHHLLPHNWAITLWSCSIAMLFHNCAASQSSYLHWINFLSALHSNLEIPVGVELAPTTISWHVYSMLSEKKVEIWLFNLAMNILACLLMYMCRSCCRVHFSGTAGLQSMWMLNY